MSAYWFLRLVKPEVIALTQAPVTSRVTGAKPLLRPRGHLSSETTSSKNTLWVTVVKTTTANGRVRRCSSKLADSRGRSAGQLVSPWTLKKFHVRIKSPVYMELEVCTALCTSSICNSFSHTRSRSSYKFIYLFAMHPPPDAESCLLHVAAETTPSADYRTWVLPTPTFARKDAKIRPADPSGGAG